MGVGARRTRRASINSLSRTDCQSVLPGEIDGLPVRPGCANGFWQMLRPRLCLVGLTNPTRRRGECPQNPRWRVGLAWPAHRGHGSEAAKNGVPARICWRTRTRNGVAKAGPRGQLSNFNYFACIPQSLSTTSVLSRLSPGRRNSVRGHRSVTRAFSSRCPWLLIARNRAAVPTLAVSTSRCQIVMRLALVMMFFLPALAFGQAKPDDEDKVSNDNPGRPLQMPPASTEVKEAIDDFERFSRRKALGASAQGALHDPRGPGAAVRRRRERLHHPGRAETTAALVRAAAGRPGGLSLVLRRRGPKLLDEAERPGGAEKPRAHLLGLFHHGRRRQRGRSAGRSLFRARAVRSRGRLLAGRLARTPRHRPVARLAVGEGRSGIVPRGPASRIRADPRRADGSVQRREGHPRGPDRPCRVSTCLAS